VGQANLALTHAFGKTRFEYGARWNTAGSSGDDIQNVPVLTASHDYYATLDAYFRYKIATNAVVTVRGSNLTNAQYAPLFGYPAQGRGWTLEISTR
jgi:outer membrane cobalamin receptor